MARLSRRLWGGTSLKIAAEEASLSATSINNFFQTSHIVSGFVSEKTLFHGCCATSLRKWWWLKFFKMRDSIVQ